MIVSYKKVRSRNKDTDAVLEEVSKARVNILLKEFQNVVDRLDIKPLDVNHDNKKHQHEQNHKPDLLRYFLYLKRNFFSGHHLDQIKEYMAAIQNGNGKQIDDSQINREDRHEKDKGNDSPL